MFKAIEYIFTVGNRSLGDLKKLLIWHKRRHGQESEGAAKLQPDADKKLSTLGPTTLRMWAPRWVPHRLVIKMSDFLQFCLRSGNYWTKNGTRHSLSLFPMSMWFGVM